MHRPAGLRASRRQNGSPERGPLHPTAAASQRTVHFETLGLSFSTPSARSGLFSVPAVSAPPHLLCPVLGALSSGAGRHRRGVCLALTPVRTVSSWAARLWPLLGPLPTPASWCDARARGTARTLAGLNYILWASLPPAAVTRSRACCLGWCQPLLLGDARGEVAVLLGLSGGPGPGTLPGEGRGRG